MAAVGQHGELHARRAAVVEQRVDRGADGAPRVEHVVDEHDRVVLERERQVARADLGGVARRDVVAVERDVELPGGNLGLEQVGDEPVQPRRQMGAAPVDADERDRPVGVLLDDLVRDPHERAPDVVLVEDDLGMVHVPVPSWPRRAGLKGRGRT
jgi:hypothetical protein